MRDRSKGRKQFFFEKKNQKTFGLEVRRWQRAGPHGQKFFGSFFQKRTAFCLTLIGGGSSPSGIGISTGGSSTGTGASGSGKSAGGIMGG
jgi:hypothetical protein